MTTGELNDAVQIKNPYVFRNNRGSVKTDRGYMTFGIPAPPRGRKEKDDDYKGGDYIGFDCNGRFLNIEVKGDGDIIKPGQVRFHNWVIEHGARSEIWKGDGTIIRYKTTVEEVNGQTRP